MGSSLKTLKKSVKDGEGDEEDDEDEDVEDKGNVGDNEEDKDCPIMNKQTALIGLRGWVGAHGEKFSSLVNLQPLGSCLLPHNSPFSPGEEYEICLRDKATELLGHADGVFAAAGGTASHVLGLRTLCIRLSDNEQLEEVDAVANMLKDMPALQ